MSDPTEIESARREMVEVINSIPGTKEELEKEYGKGNVFDTEEATKKFHFIGFMAPFAYVEEKEHGIKGILTFQHAPRFYFDFQEE